jgi:hypothetical protein
MIVLVGKLGAGVELEHDHLHAAGPLHLRMFIHRHAPAVVGHLQSAVGAQHHVDVLGIPGDGLVHAVVDDFLGQVVGPGSVGIHPRPAFDRLQILEDLDRGRVVCVAAAPVFKHFVGHWIFPL